MIVQVLENLFLGSLDDAENNDLLRQHDIHAILTIDAKPLMLGIEIPGQCKHLPLLDMSSEDLLSHLEETTQYIEGYRSDNKSVIVHCHAGRSRSSAAVIAYLMWKLQMDYEESHKYLKKMKPDIMPNEGFVEQLKMYECMGWKVDRSSPVYRAYQLERITEMVTAGRAMTQISRVLDSLHDSATSTATQITYKCRKCRRLLFTEGHIITHTEGGGEATFLRPWQKQTTTKSACSKSLFIEPIKWMQRTGLHEQQGKIACVKCSAKIGSWSWAGERCSCGTWVTPAFHIDVKKVDKSLPALPAHTVQASPT